MSYIAAFYCETGIVGAMEFNTVVSESAVRADAFIDDSKPHHATSLSKVRVTAVTICRKVSRKSTSDLRRLNRNSIEIWEYLSYCADEAPAKKENRTSSELVHGKRWESPLRLDAI
jgi:hypothetical protein